MIIRWPFVSRATYLRVVKEYVARLDALRQHNELLRNEISTLKAQAAKPKRVRKPAAPAIDTIGRTAPQVVMNSTSPAQRIARAIRSVAGADRALARHLRQFADEQLALEVPVAQIVQAIHRGQEVQN